MVRWDTVTRTVKSVWSIGGVLCQFPKRPSIQSPTVEEVGGEEFRRGDLT